MALQTSCSRLFLNTCALATIYTCELIPFTPRGCIPRLNPAAPCMASIDSPAFSNRATCPSLRPYLELRHLAARVLLHLLAGRVGPPSGFGWVHGGPGFCLVCSWMLCKTAAAPLASFWTRSQQLLGRGGFSCNGPVVCSNQ